MSKKIAVLAVQGAFIEHERALAKLGCECIELRQGPDVEQPYDALVLPGGESTAQAKMLRELGMLDTLKSRVAAGLPVLGTCAGLILLAQNVEEGVPAAGDPNGPVAAGKLPHHRPVCGFARRTGWRNRRHPHDLHPRPVHQGGA